jgi:hypothetical protein
MNRFAFVVSVVCVSLLGFLFQSNATADEWNKKTLITFDQPVELPGVVLPAGTYVFKLFDSQADRNIVQVFNKDENHLYATIMAIPDYRLTPTGNTVLKFSESPAGSPEAIKAWFYPGDNFGEEFVYPKSRAVELAKRTNQPVISMPEEQASNISKPIKSAKEPAVMAMKKASIKAVTPAGEQEEVIMVATTQPPNQSSTMQAKNHKTEKLPKTASSLPLLAVCGMLLLGAGLGLRLLSRRFAPGTL